MKRPERTQQGKESQKPILKTMSRSIPSRSALSSLRSILLLFGLALIFLAVPVARADIRIEEKSNNGLFIHITGTITEGDAQAAKDLVQKMERDPFFVILDSEGGDVSAAMNIGRLVRKSEGDTAVPVPSKCYSSCALIFIAGVRRVNLGEVGLHRPYFASEPQSRQSLESQFPALLSALKNYVAEMGVTDNFYQQMVNAGPSQMRVYFGDEILALVPSDDPLHDEVEIAYEARKHGISTLEMRSRNQDAKQCIDLFLEDVSKSSQEIFYCQGAKKWGLSDRVYKERIKLVEGSCRLSADEVKFLEDLPKRERRDHPLWVRVESCRRHIMLMGSPP